MRSLALGLTLLLAICASLLGCGESEGGKGAGGAAGHAMSGAGAGAATGGASGGSGGGAGAGKPGAAGDAGENGGSAGSGNEAGTNAAAGAGLADCDPRKILCKRIAPECVAGEAPSVDGSCYGDCVKIELCACADAAQCPDPNQYTCWAKNHCGPFVQ